MIPSDLENGCKTFKLIESVSLALYASINDQTFFWLKKELILYILTGKKVKISKRLYSSIFIVKLCRFAHT